MLDGSGSACDHASPSASRASGLRLNARPRTSSARRRSVGAARSEARTRSEPSRWESACRRGSVRVAAPAAASRSERRRRAGLPPRAARRRRRPGSIAYDVGNAAVCRETTGAVVALHVRRRAEDQDRSSAARSRVVARAPGAQAGSRHWSSNVGAVSRADRKRREAWRRSCRLHSRRDQIAEMDRVGLQTRATTATAAAVITGR